MSVTPVDLQDVRPEPEAAKRRYLEESAGLLVNNYALRIALILSLVINVGLMAAHYRLLSGADLAKPFVVLVDDKGRTAVLTYEDLKYRPGANEVRYFLGTFAQQHFSRQRGSIAEDFPQSLHFLEERLAGRAMDEFRRQGTLDGVLSGASQEVKIVVENVIVRDLTTPPYHAAIDFEKVYLSPYGSADRREKFTAEVAFFFQDRVPNDVVPVNPLGLTIQDLSLHQAFSGGGAR